jgi:hypothetical protein
MAAHVWVAEACGVARLFLARSHPPAVCRARVSPNKRGQHIIDLCRSDTWKQVFSQACPYFRIPI